MERLADQGQRYRTKNMWMTAKIPKGFLFSFKSGKRIFPSSRTLCFSKCLRHFLVLTIQSLEMIKQQINPSFTLTFNDINVTAPQRPHLQKPHFPDTIPIAELHWRCSRLSRHWWSDVICSPLPVLKQWLNSC